MDDYCAQDVKVNMAVWRKVWDRFEKDEVPLESIRMENEVLRIIAGQELHGFCFDETKARALEAELFARKADLDAALRQAFKPWVEPQRKYGKPIVKVAKRRTKVRRWDENFEEYFVEVQKGETYELQQLVMFNPASRAHIANRLTTLYGWQPKVFTESGQPEISEETLDGMDFPEAPLLKEYLMVDKRIGMLSTGKQAWFNHLRPDGRIHGRVNTNQAVTGRMTHTFPNVAQVPACGAPYGKQCRELFHAPLGWLLVGCDAEGLELRCLGHFMGKYDGGAYGDTVVNGDKSKGTDIHSVNQRAVGLFSRDSAKTFIYALVYGGGDAKLGEIAVADMPDEARREWLAKHTEEKNPKDKRGRTYREIAYARIGAAKREAIMQNLPALGKLVNAVQSKVKKQGWIRGIDGRKLPIRKAHAALNTLLQSAGALVMKKALVLMEEEFRARGWVVLWDYQNGDLFFVANIHDEVQIEAKEEIAKQVATIAAECIRRAGEYFGFRCPLAGSADVGHNWAETH
jgi:DNA polymerase I-like protein with 3'-5' exonuclease and polymerase domains